MVKIRKNIGKIVLGIGLLAFVFVMNIQSANAATFGNFLDTSGSGTRSDAFCAPYTMPVTGTVTSISSEWNGTSLTGAYAIYTDNGGVVGSNLPVNLVATSSTIAVPAAQAWATSTISATLTGGTIYWLCEWANGSYTYWYREAGLGSNQDFSGGFTWETWKNPWVDAGSHTTRQPAMYATYTTSSGAVATDDANNFMTFQ